MATACTAVFPREEPASIDDLTRDQLKAKGEVSTRAAKARTPAGKAKTVPVITPAAQAGRAEIEFNPMMITPYDEVYPVLTNAKAWALLKFKFGFECKSNNYYLISHEKPIGTSLAGLR